MLDEGLSLPVVVETPQLKISSNSIHFTISSPAVEFSMLVPHTSVRHIQSPGMMQSLLSTSGRHSGKGKISCRPIVCDALGKS